MLRTLRLRQRDKTKDFGEATPSAKTEPGPRLKVAKIGIVSRDYRHEYENGFRDFSEAFPDILKRLDEEGCDTVLFSLYSIVPRKEFDPFRSMRLLRNIKAVLYEEFKDGKKRKIKGSVVLYRGGHNKWHQYRLPGGGFASLKGPPKGRVEWFVQHVIPRRILGNCCAILCGESNGVRWSQERRRVEDVFGLRRSLPKEVTVVLNPGHDRMIPYQMKCKRRFLSQNDRWVISVWNRGKRDSSHRRRDGTKPPWTVFHNGKKREIVVEPMPNQMGVEIGILKIGGAQRSDPTT
jgi:hypothetical protein